MTIYSPERKVTVKELNDWLLLDGGGGDGGGIIEFIGLPEDGDNERRAGAEPYPVAHLVGKVTLEETVLSLEAKWEGGQRLSADEMHLLRLHEEVLDLDYEV